MLTADGDSRGPEGFLSHVLGDQQSSAIDPDLTRLCGTVAVHGPSVQPVLPGRRPVATSKDNKVDTYGVLRPSLGNRIVLFPAASVGRGGHKVLLRLQGREHRP